MKHQRTIGIALLLLGFLVVLGMMISIPIIWMVIDIAVIVICSGNGLYLLLRKTQI